MCVCVRVCVCACVRHGPTMLFTGHDASASHESTLGETQRSKMFYTCENGGLGLDFGVLD